MDDDFELEIEIDDPQQRYKVGDKVIAKGGHAMGEDRRSLCVCTLLEEIDFKDLGAPRSEPGFRVKFEWGERLLMPVHKKRKVRGKNKHRLESVDGEFYIGANDIVGLAGKQRSVNGLKKVAYPRKKKK